MGQRLQLHQKLSEILGSNHVYFQPPPTVNLVYPCIIYKRIDIDTMFADDNPYITNKRYQVTVIDSNPDSSIPDEIGKMSKCSYDRHYTSNNLNHDVYSLFY